MYDQNDKTEEVMIKQIANLAKTSMHLYTCMCVLGYLSGFCTYMQRLLTYLRVHSVFVRYLECSHFLGIPTSVRVHVGGTTFGVGTSVAAPWLSKDVLTVNRGQ